MPRPSDTKMSKETQANVEFLEAKVDPSFTPLLEEILRQKPADVDAFALAYFEKKAAEAPRPVPPPRTYGPGQARKLHVVHFNDVYNLLPNSSDMTSLGGAERFATKIKQMRAADPHLLVVFGGDFVGPSLTSAITKGRHMVEVLDEIGVDFGCFGNHEFDYGLKTLDKILHQPMNKYGISTSASRVQWLSTNINGGDGQPICGAAKSACVDWHGVKVGLLSVSQNWLPGCTKLKPGEAAWEDDVKACRAACQDLRSQGAEVVLAVTHSVFAQDQALMAQVPPEELDLLCGGHDHDYYRDAALRIVKAGQEWRWLSDIEFELPPVGAAGPAKLVKCEQVDIGVSLPPDPKIGRIVAKWEGMVALKAAKPVGVAKVALDSTEAFTRWKEGALTNWICDVVAEDYSEAEGTQEADFAMLNGYSVAGKKVTPAGALNYGHLLTWFPKPSVVVVLKLRGSDVLRSLERGCKDLPGECGGLHHTSKQLTYEIDLAKPAKGGRVGNVRFKSSPLDLNKVYDVACTADMAAGKFGYGWMGAAPRVVDEEFGTPLLDLCRAWLKRHKGEAVDPANTGGRLVIKNGPE